MHYYGAIVRMLLFAIMVLLFCACSASGTMDQATSPDGTPGLAADPVEPGAPFAGFPLPSVMLAQCQAAAVRHASYVENDLTKDGTEYENSLPHNLVNDEESAKISFHPAWGAPGRTLADLAYCVYHFQAADYDRNEQVRVNWSAAPAESSLWFAGLANWDLNRWDWFAGTDSGHIDLASLEPYMDFTDNLLLVVACLGTDPCMLAGVRLGGLPPEVHLEATPTIGGVPLAVNFDASESVPVEGLKLSYRWDFEGDGDFEYYSEDDPTVYHSYRWSGARHTHLRVTNINNATKEISVFIQAVGEWTHTWRLTDYDTIEDVVVDDDGRIYAVGTTYYIDGSRSSVLLLSVSPCGELNWARAWDADDDDHGYAIGLTADGHILVAGTMTDGATDVLVQKWSKQGTLEWSRHHGGESTEKVVDMTVVGNDAYICGSTLSTVAFWDYDYFLMHCLSSGTQDWTRSRDNHEGEDEATAVCATGDAFSGVEGLAVVGQSESPDGQAAWMVEYGVDGSFIRARELGAPAWHVHPAGLLYSRHPMTLATRYYLTGELLDEGQVFLHCSDGDGLVQYASRVMLDEPAYISSMSFGNDSLIYICGTWEDTEYDRGMIWGFDYNDGDLQRQRYYDAATGRSYFNTINTTNYGAIIGGASYGWSAHLGNKPLEFNNFGVSWSDAPGQGTTTVWTYNTSITGAVYDITATYQASEDDDGGQRALLYHHPLD